MSTSSLDISHALAILRLRTVIERHPTSMPSTTVLSQQIVVGSRVRATVATAICHAGERGFVYEIYARGPQIIGYSILFERGGHDRFASDEILTKIDLLNQTDPRVQHYRFVHIGVLLNDYRRGRFPLDWA